MESGLPFKEIDNGRFFVMQNWLSLLGEVAIGEVISSVDDCIPLGDFVTLISRGGCYKLNMK